LNDGPSVSNLNPVNGIWTHVAAVYDASTNQGSVYVNGIKDSSTVYTYKEITTLSGIKPYLGTNNVRYSYANLSIGGFDGSNGLFKGRMDDIRIYPLALTDAEVFSVVNEKMLITNLVTTSPGLVPNTTISLSWTAPTGVTVSSYVLKQSIDEGVSWTIPGSYGIVIGLGTATIDGLTTGTRYAFSVAAVSGGKTGLSAIINTSTFGNPVFRLVGVGSNPVVDIVSGRQLTLGSAGTTLDANTATAISGITRKVMTIPNTGYITIGGDMPAGSHSFCCWMKATACTTLFQYSTVRGAGGVGGDSDIQHLIWTGNSPGAFGLSTAIFGISPQVHTHSAKTLRVIAGGVIECDGDHTLTNNQEIRFEKSYFGPNATITPATFITSDTSYFVNVVSTTQFSLKVSSGGAAVSPVPPVGSFVTGVFIPNSAHTSNTTWVHVASVYDQINGTSSIYLTTTFAGVAPKTLVPRLFRVSGDRVVFPGVTRGSVAADLFQIGKYSNTAPNFNGLVDDFRAYAKVLSPQEIAAIAAGDA
jgi:hypothetical protein